MYFHCLKRFGPSCRRLCWNVSSTHHVEYIWLILLYYVIPSLATSLHHFNQKTGKMVLKWIFYKNISQHITFRKRWKTTVKKIKYYLVNVDVYPKTKTGFMELMMIIQMWLFGMIVCLFVGASEHVISNLYISRKWASTT